MESITAFVDNMKTTVLSHIGMGRDCDAELESEARAFYERVGSSEWGQNQLAKYRFELFQVREVNEEVVRRANLASTRMGRVQQTVNEFAQQMDALHRLASQNSLDSLRVQLDEAAKQVREVERFALQTELAMGALESLLVTKNGQQIAEEENTTEREANE